MSKQFLLLILSVFGIQVTGFSQIDSTYQDVDEVIISSKRKKTIAFEDPKYYIVDFTVSETRTLLLMKNLGIYYIYELDQDMNFRHKLRLDVNANSLFDDCFGNTHVVTKDSLYFILDDSLGIFLTETQPKRRFIAAISKCVGMTSEKFAFKKSSSHGIDQTFYTLDRNSGDTKVIYEINDSTISKSLRDTEMLKWAEDNCEDDPNRSTETRSFSNKANQEQYFPSFFYRSYSPPEYNPLFIVDDTLYIFNHAEGRIDQLDEDGNLISSTRINYQFMKGWEEVIYSDKEMKKFYAVWMKNGVQHLIGLALTDEEQNFSAKITKHAYPEKVIVRNGYVYYAYKPNFDASLNKLYRQKL
jgi:hypothetical protein